MSQQKQPQQPNNNRMPLAQSSPALLMLTGGNSSSEKAGATPLRHVIVHPLAILHVLDHHSRRQEQPPQQQGGSDDAAATTTATDAATTASTTTTRVIGTLLGRVLDGNTVEITNCFAVPHAERGDEVAIGKDYNKKMLALHTRSSKEVVVGWYASSCASSSNSNSSGTSNSLVADTSCLIHEFYAGECEDNDPVHLVVDTRLLDDCLQIKAYKSAPVIVQGDHVGNVFHELRLSLHSNEPETICLQEMIKGSNIGGSSSSISSSSATREESKSTNGLQVSMEQLYELLDSTLQYVDAVVAGKVPHPDAEQGRLIADTLATVPRVRPEIYDKLFHGSLQDLLMVTYLSNLTRTQLEIAERLNATLGGGGSGGSV